MEDGSSEDPFTVGETPIVSQPGCNSDELGSIELEMNGGVQPMIKWYKLSVAQQSATSSGTGTSTATSSSTTIEFSDGGILV